MCGGSGAWRLWEGGEAGEGCGQFVPPGPVFGDALEHSPLAKGDADGDVQEPAAHRLRIAPGELTVQQDGLRPGDQIAGGQRELEPHRVDRGHPG
jgi:hypothetical protein